MEAVSYNSAEFTPNKSEITVTMESNKSKDIKQMSEVDQIVFDNNQTANFGTLIDQKPSKYFIEDVTVTFKLLISKRMRPIIPQMLWTGASVAYWSGLLSPINSKFLHHENRKIHEDEVLEKC